MSREESYLHWVWMGLAMILIGITVLLCSCGVPPEPVADTVATVAPTTTVEVIAEVVEPATAHMSAVRVDPPEPTIPPPPDPCTLEQYVNELSYQPDDPTPVVVNYRIVAACLGWSTATIDFYQASLANDLWPKESRMCWNLQRGQGIAENCRLFGPIQGDDTGFFQITSSAHGPTGVLCRDYGYCGSASIKQSPWHSMRSGLLLIMRSGKFPWTWNGDACRYHWQVCGIWPETWVNL